MVDAELFPDKFLFGAATSAYQIEGSPLADGAGPSNWHRFAHTRGRTHENETGDVACDHYRRYADDVALMAEFGLNAYRFSIAWSRVLPEGRGRVNPQGLGFYERLVDALLARGIQPMATLFHWDLPAALDDRGGWLNPDSAGWFADYASIVFSALADRVPLWATLNEPWVVTDGGYLHGVLAPGHRNLFEAPIAAWNLMRAHAEAVRAYRSIGRQQIGLVVNLEPKYPASANPADQAATERAHQYMNAQFLDPLLLGQEPPLLAEVYGAGWVPHSAGELAELRAPVDFLGINYYTRAVVAHDAQCWPTAARSVRQAQSTYTEMGWEVYPQGLTDTLLWVRQRYGDVPLYITENGAAFYDPPTAGGAISDPLRIDYLRAHLRAAHAAMQRGVPLRGYFAWSLLDNYEWSLGYAKRFGLVHVDFTTQQRTPKASLHFYREIIRSTGAALKGD